MYCSKCPAYKSSRGEDWMDEYCVVYGDEFSIPNGKEKINEDDEIIGCALRPTQVKKIMGGKGWLEK